MPTGALRPCPGHCGTLVTKGRCAACARVQNIHRGSARRRGYDAAWEAFRPVFIGRLVALGIAPVCGASLPSGPRTNDSACRATGLLIFTSADGSSLHFDHDPELTERERHDRQAVCDPARIQLLCASCHSAKTARDQM
jgi:hypothetical protein